MMRYVWQSERWPNLVWAEAPVLEALARCRLAQGRLLGRLSGMEEGLALETRAAVLEEEAIQTSSIEGRELERRSVRSSVARRLGLPFGGLPASDRDVDGLVSVLLDAVEGHDEPLSAERLKGWHAALFPTGYSGFHRVRVAEWRGESPMRVVSGPVGREKIHYEAPPHDRVEPEMTAFLKWWNSERADMDGILRAGVAHFRFVTIHPFEDGNGRLARALTDMALARDDGVRRRYYSLSARIREDRSAYYEVLERNQKGTGDITEWLVWFLNTVEAAVRHSESLLAVVFARDAFWRRHARTPLNERQIEVLNRLLETGPDGFEGGLTTRKYAAITHASRATAQRDISDLLEKGVLRPNPGGGRSASYAVAFPLP